MHGTGDSGRPPIRGFHDRAGTDWIPAAMGRQVRGLPARVGENLPVGGARTVLVVGCGIAGATFARLAGRTGWEVTVVERADRPRSSGNPVDVRGAALRVAERIGVLAAIRSAATRATRLVAVDDRGRPIGWIPTQTGRDAIEVSRSDLAAILVGGAENHAEFRFDDTVTGLREVPAGVEVSFARAPQCLFDLVVGADGLHSTVRRLAGDVGQDPRGRHRLLVDRYGGLRWRVPELLDRVRDSDDGYFDAVTRVRLDRWSRGRITLIGDAADCVSLFGEGSSMAMVGAATLAGSLAAHPHDTAAALRTYESVHRRRVRPHLNGAAVAGHFLVPRTGGGVTARDLLFGGFAAAAATIRRATS